MSKSIFDIIKTGSTEELKNLLDKDESLVNEIFYAESNPFSPYAKPLDFACIFGKIEALKILLNKGADLLFINLYEDTTFHHATASQKPNKDIIKLYFEALSQKYPSKIIEHLNKQNQEKSTALHQSVITAIESKTSEDRQESYRIIEFLLQNGAAPSLEISDKDQNTPLDLAKKDESLSKILTRYLVQQEKENLCKTLDTKSSEILTLGATLEQSKLVEEGESNASLQSKVKANSPVLQGR